MALARAVEAIQAHVALVVETMLKETYSWASDRARDWCDLQEITPGQLAALCHVYEMMKDFPSKLTLSQVISRLGSRSGDDISTWLHNSFEFDATEIKNFFKECKECDLQEVDRYFNAVDVNNKYELLSKAASEQDYEIINWLVRNGVDVNRKDSEGLTPLHIAARDDDIETVKFLLDKGANCYAMDHQWEVPFDKALQCRYSPIEEFPTADLLLPHVFADKFYKHNGNTRLHKAALDGDALRLRYLLGKVDDVDIRNKDGFTCLHIGAMRGYPEVVKLLIEYGADLKARTKKPKKLTALELARELGHTEVEEILVTVASE